MGLPVQPFIVAVGSSSRELEKYYICVDEVMNENSSFLSSLDALFKIYITLNAAYPKKSENFCYFIQWYLFKIETNVDVQIPCIYNIINRLKRSDKVICK